MTHNVPRKGMVGILSCIKQEELKSKKVQIETWGAENVAVLKGDPKLTKLLEAIFMIPSLYTISVWFHNS